MRTRWAGQAVQPPPSDVHKHIANLETQDVPVRLEAILWLTATVIVVGPVRVVGPIVGLDNGWATGLNLSRKAGLRHGREFVFSYGPWGFLDVPQAITRPDFLLGLAFSVASLVVTWLFILTVLRSKLRPNVALPATTLLTLTLSSVSSPSFLLTAVALVACVRHLRQSPAQSTTWLPVSVAGLAGLLLQIKFPEGVAVTVFAFATTLVSPRVRLMRAASSGLTWLVTSLVLWVLAGQSVADIGPWLHGSTEVVKGYASAMSQEMFALPFAWYLLTLLLVVSILVLGWGRDEDCSVVSHLGSLFVIAGALVYGFKQSFTRHESAHNAAFFAIAVLMLCALLERGPKWRATLLLIALASVMASPGVSMLVRANPVDSWALTWRFVTSDVSRSALLNQTRANDQAAYGLPAALVEATQGHAVSVDPWEVSMVWAYSMRWRPMPVLQSYAAYTTYLDQLNADAAQDAGDEQMIIRATTVSTRRRPTVFDGRNPMWESPRYTLVVLCNYSFVTADKRWMLLRKGVNRCGDPSPTAVVRQVRRGEPIEVPKAGADEIVVASFVRAKPNPVVSIVRLLFKDLEPLIVSVDGKPFRLPDGVASGPLLTLIPSTSDWPAEFKGQTSTRSVSFSRPGTVEFRTIQMTR